MREILFRGKRVDNGEWIYGTTCFSEDGNLACMFYIVNGCETMTRIDPETVGQYTGLKDKNGKKIFEGDVVYIAGLGDTETAFPFVDLYASGFENDIGEVIGTIHEKPDCFFCDTTKTI